jgi:integrase
VYSQPPAGSYPLGQTALVAQEKRAETYRRAATSARTRHEYERDWADFASYCAERYLPALPSTAQTVALYLGSLGGRLKISTIRRRVVAIARMHAEGDFETPTRHDIVREIVASIAREHGSTKVQKTALTRELLTEILPHAMDLRGLRDRALLLLGFAGALRRSELVALDVDDLHFSQRGLAIRLRRSKTNPAAAGRDIGVPYTNNQPCAATAVRVWLDAAAIQYGAVFRSFSLRHGARPSMLQDRRLTGGDVARIVQRYTQGLAGDFAAHSLRAGFVTSAAQKKVPEIDIMRVTGHRSVATLRDYVRKATPFDDAPLLWIFADPDSSER